MAGLLPLCYVGEVKVGQVAWKTKVIVLAKSNILRHRVAKRSVQKCLVEDAEGTPIEVIMWDDNIARFEGTLEPLHTYMIQGAEVEKIDDLQWARDRKLEWRMIGRTVVEEVTAEGEMLRYPPIDFTDLAVVESFSPYTDLFDAVAAVVHVGDPQQIEAGPRVTWIQNIWLTDRSLTRTPITLSDGFLKNQGVQLSALHKCMPVIVCWNLNISAYTGFPCTNVSSYILIDPDIAEVRSLRAWVSGNMIAVRALRSTMRPKRPNMGTPGTERTITDAGQSSSGEPKYNITGTLRIPDPYESMLFCECKKCCQTVVADMNKEVLCRNCSELQLAMPRYRVVVCIRTKQGTVQATMFGAIAQQLLQQTPEEIHNTTSQDLRKFVRKINQAYKRKTITAIIGNVLKEYSSEDPIFVVEDWSELEIPN